MKITVEAKWVKFPKHPSDIALALDTGELLGRTKKLATKKYLADVAISDRDKCTGDPMGGYWARIGVYNSERAAKAAVLRALRGKK